mmetsp:Transcript_4894/g.7436  ORF Transcript_4894/g.7436 Transcript_4894/m.7436 type:complete len:696 (+) Transcript_4894:104-2191(+)
MHSSSTSIYRTTIRHGVRSLRAASTSSASSEKQTSAGIKASTALGIASLSLCLGYSAGTMNSKSTVDQNSKRVLPSGLPRGCCSCDAPPVELTLTEEQMNLPSKLIDIVGKDNILLGLTEDSSNAKFLKGARLGKGKALAIIQPESMMDAVKALEAIVNADCVVIPQGRNTGLTGGSVPREDDASRPTVIINMTKLDTMFPIDGGKRVVCLAGSGIAALANNLPVWGFGDRESHSTLGSTFLNPTTAGGVAFGSGGTQLRKGPAFTDRALYVKVSENKWGKRVVEVVNTLGIEGIEDTDFVNNSGNTVEQLDIYAHDIKMGYTRPMAQSSKSVHGKGKASDTDYPNIVCECGNDRKGNTVSRCNADTKGQDCNRSEGKVLILATVHDTFPKPHEKKTFWISCVDFETAQKFRKEVCLDNPKDLPLSVEYMDRDSFDVIDKAGRIMANLIKVVGVGSFVGLLWDVKLKIAAMSFEGADLLCDQILYRLNDVFPSILPSRFMESGIKMDHHIAMSVGEFGEGELERCLERISKFENENFGKIVIQECQSKSEEMSLTAFRFVAAPAFRTWCVGNNVQGFSVDYAMPKNSGEAPPLEKQGSSVHGDQAIPLKRMRYSHFGCNVVHEDLAYDLGVDVHSAHVGLKNSVSGCGGKLPAEHGHGTEYDAPKESQDRWKTMDPLNVMNPGIGGLSAKFKYKD